MRSTHISAFLQNITSSSLRAKGTAHSGNMSTACLSKVSPNSYKCIKEPIHYFIICHIFSALIDDENGGNGHSRGVIAPSMLQRWEPPAGKNVTHIIMVPQERSLNLKLTASASILMLNLVEFEFNSIVLFLDISIPFPFTLHHWQAKKIRRPSKLNGIVVFGCI